MPWTSMEFSAIAAERALSLLLRSRTLSLSLSLTKILCLFPEKSDTINFDHVLFFSYLCCFFF